MGVKLAIGLGAAILSLACLFLFFLAAAFFYGAAEGCDPDEQLCVGPTTNEAIGIGFFLLIGGIVVGLLARFGWSALIRRTRTESSGQE